MKVERQIRMPAIQVEGLSDVEIGAALAYELEPETHIPAAEAEVSWTAEPSEDRAYHVFLVHEVSPRQVRAASSGLARAVKPLLALIGVLIVFGAVDAVYLMACEQSFERRIRTSEPLQRQLDQLANRRQTAERARDEHLSAVRASQAAEAESARQRAAFPKLLSTVSRVFAHRAALTGLKTVKLGVVELEGVTADTLEATNLQIALGDALAAEGWTLEAGEVVMREEGAKFDVTVRRGK